MTTYCNGKIHLAPLQVKKQLVPALPNPLPGPLCPPLTVVAVTASLLSPVSPPPYASLHSVFHVACFWTFSEQNPSMCCFMFRCFYFTSFCCSCTCRSGHSLSLLCTVPWASRSQTIICFPWMSICVVSSLWLIQTVLREPSHTCPEGWVEIILACL